MFVNEGDSPSCLVEAGVSAEGVEAGGQKGGCNYCPETRQGLEQAAAVGPIRRYV